MYREAGLTIARLARSSICRNIGSELLSTRLGFRNFNAMLHAYRVEEASQALVDADKQGAGVDHCPVGGLSVDHAI